MAEHCLGIPAGTLRFYSAQNSGLSVTWQCTWTPARTAYAIENTKELLLTITSDCIGIEPANDRN
jgi:hypothetical protein